MHCASPLFLYNMLIQFDACVMFRKSRIFLLYLSAPLLQYYNTNTNCLKLTSADQLLLFCY